MPTTITLVIYLLSGGTVTTSLPSMDECLAQGFGIAQAYSIVRFDCIKRGYIPDMEV